MTSMPNLSGVVPSKTVIPCPRIPGLTSESGMMGSALSAVASSMKDNRKMKARIVDNRMISAIDCIAFPPNSQRAKRRNDASLLWGL